MIMEKFASNEGTMGTLGGVMGGAMGGIVMGNTISEVARNALSPENAAVDHSRKDVSGVAPVMGGNAGGAAGGFDVTGFLSGRRQNGTAQAEPPQTPSPQTPTTEPDQEQTTGVLGGRPLEKTEAGGAAPASGTKFCTNCGAAHRCVRQILSPVWPATGPRQLPPVRQPRKAGDALLPGMRLPSEVKRRKKP